MCGIAGSIANSPYQYDSRQVLDSMLDQIVHRGPDDAGFFYGNRAYLGMRRLSIIDLKTGSQPVYSADRQWLIVFNGELYNYRQLRKKLEAEQISFSTHTDTEVVLQMYIRYGADALQYFNGMFAFCIYNQKTHQAFVARDRFGIKPLYYTFTNREFVFASELKSLLKHPHVDKQLNIEALNLYLTFEHIPAPYSIFKDVYKLMPGHYMLIKSGKAEIRRYYQYTFSPKLKNVAEEKHIATIDALINSAVKERMVSDVPLGAFLSGGIDSSLIAAYLQKNSSQPIHTYSIGFEEKSFDESSHAREVARFLGTKHHEKLVTPQILLNLLPQILQQTDEPFADASLLPTYALAQFTRQQLTVALSGDGADEVFAGYPTYLARKAGRFIPRFAAYPAQMLANWLPVSDNNISFDFKVKAFAKGLPYKQDMRHQIWLGAFSPAQKLRLLGSDLKEQLDLQNDLEILRQHQLSCDTENNWERSLWADMRFYLQDNMLVKVDRASMYNSLEVRVPFLDHQLVDYVCKLPASLKYRGHTSKYILKKLAADKLPAGIVNRTKKGFGMPVAKWIKTDMRQMMQDTLSHKSIAQQGFFNPDYVDKLLQNHLANKQDNRKLLWTLFMFQKWHENFMR